MIIGKQSRRKGRSQQLTILLMLLESGQQKIWGDSGEGGSHAVWNKKQRMDMNKGEGLRYAPIIPTHSGMPQRPNHHLASGAIEAQEAAGAAHPVDGAGFGGSAGPNWLLRGAKIKWPHGLAAH